MASVYLCTTTRPCPSQWRPDTVASYPLGWVLSHYVWLHTLCNVATILLLVENSAMIVHLSYSNPGMQLVKPENVPILWKQYKEHPDGVEP